MKFAALQRQGGRYRRRLSRRRLRDLFGNFARGDISKPGETKEAIRLLLGIIRMSAPKAVIELLHHARTGRANIPHSSQHVNRRFGSAVYQPACSNVTLLYVSNKAGERGWAN